MARIHSNLIRFACLFFALHFPSLWGQSAKAQEVDVKNLVHMTPAFFELETHEILLAIQMDNAPKWHTYWSNPGDAGIATKIELFSGKESLPLEMIEWPIPERFIEGDDIVTQGFTGRYYFFFKTNQKILAAIRNGATLKGSWLVCSNICIPGMEELTIKERKGSSLLIPEAKDYQVENFEKAYAGLPQKNTENDAFEFYLLGSSEPNKLKLYYTHPWKEGLEIPSVRNFITPYLTPPFGFKHEKLFLNPKDNILVGEMEIEWDGDYLEPKVPLPVNGNFEKPYQLKFLAFNPNSKKYVTHIETVTSFSLNSDLIATWKKDLIPFQNKNATTATEAPSDVNSFSLPMLLLFAFFGGLILNFMPCVLPVISIKLFSLLKQSSESKSKIIRHNLFYSAGILFSFLSLSILVILLKKSGTAVGWGMQMQSPHFLVVMILVLFTMSLNLFGLFEFQTPGGRMLGNVKIEDSFLGDFFSGILATILSTPCSAPFLGTALTFAFTGSTLESLFIFTFVGLGLSFPFLLTTLFPGLIQHFPKPGKWMNHLKKVLGLALIATILWLFDIFITLGISTSTITQLLALLALVFFSFFSLNQRYRQAIVWALFIISLSGTALFLITLKTENTVLASSDLNKESYLPWEVWSEKKVEELKAEKKIAFINFTAKWCLTCKVNEKLFLNTKEFKSFTEENKLLLLKGDWTKRDEAITSWLNRYKMVGVPAYFLLNKNGEIVSLGETISLEKIKRELHLHK